MKNRSEALHPQDLYYLAISANLLEYTEREACFEPRTNEGGVNSDLKPQQRFAIEQLQPVVVIPAG